MSPTLCHTFSSEALSALVVWEAYTSHNDPMLFQASSSAIWQPTSGRYFPGGYAEADISPMRHWAYIQRARAPVDISKQHKIHKAVSFPKVLDGMLLLLTPQGWTWSTSWSVLGITRYKAPRYSTSVTFWNKEWHAKSSFKVFCYWVTFFVKIIRNLLFLYFFFFFCHK